MQSAEWEKPVACWNSERGKALALEAGIVPKPALASDAPEHKPVPKFASECGVSVENVGGIVIDEVSFIAAAVFGQEDSASFCSCSNFICSFSCSHMYRPCIIVGSSSFSIFCK